MRLIFSALVILLTVSHLAGAQGAIQSKARHFSISSLNTPFALQADFEGEYRVYPDHIEVKVTKAVIRIRDDSPYKGRSILSSVRLGLAAEVAGKRWAPVSLGPEVSPGQTMRPGDVYDLGELHIDIPTGASVDLSKHWLVAQMEEVILDAPGEEAQRAYSFAHSPKNIFAQKK